MLRKAVGGACLFAALTLAGIGADSPLPAIGRWSALPALALCFALNLLPAPRGCDRAGRTGNPAARGFVVLAAITAFCLAELRLRLAGPIPHEGLSEVTWHLIALYSGAAMAFAAAPASGSAGGPGPLGRLLAWTAALGVIAATRMMLPTSAPVALRSDLLPLGVSGLVALAMLAGHAIAARGRPASQDVPDSRVPSARRWIAASVISLALVAGLVAGAAIASAERAALSATGDEPGAEPLAALLLRDEAAARLWPESVLAGFGARTAARLVEARCPSPAAPPPQWLGPRGFLAAGGVAGVVLASLLFVSLCRIAADGTASSRAAAATAAVLAGLCVTGMPGSSLILLLIAGWTGLAFRARATTPDPESARAGFVRRGLDFGARGASVVLISCVALLLLGPAWTTRTVHSVTSPADLTSPDLPRRIYRARLFNPWDPDPLLLDAARLREELSRTVSGESFDQTLFERVRRAYETAVALDPYREVSYSRLGVILHAAERDAEAGRVLEAGVDRIPGSEALADQLYYHLRDSGDTEDARRIRELLHDALRRWPASAKWKARWRSVTDTPAPVGEPDSGRAGIPLGHPEHCSAGEREHRDHDLEAHPSRPGRFESPHQLHSGREFHQRLKASEIRRTLAGPSARIADRSPDDPASHPTADGRKEHIKPGTKNPPRRKLLGGPGRGGKVGVGRRGGGFPRPSPRSTSPRSVEDASPNPHETESGHSPVVQSLPDGDYLSRVLGDPGTGSRADPTGEIDVADRRKEQSPGVRTNRIRLPGC